MTEQRYYRGSSDGKAPLKGDPLAGARERYDVLVIGSGLAGLTGANVLAKAGRKVAVLEVASRYVPDPRPHTVFDEVATPKTIRRYTGKLGGAVYGSPTKRRGGATGIEKLHLVGTDEGLLGVVGALLSGITVANREALMVGDVT